MERFGCGPHLERDGALDRETTLEDAYRWQAALDLAPVGGLWVHDFREPALLTNLDTGVVAPIEVVTRVRRTRVWGALSSAVIAETWGHYLHSDSPLKAHPDVAQERACSDAAVWPEWSTITGRRHIACGLMDPTAGDTGVDVRDAMARFAAEGVRTVSLKMLQSKAAPVYRVDIAGVADDVSARKVLLSTMADGDDGGTSPFDYLVGHLEGQEAFVIAPWVEMVDEYRVFVVNGTPVTGGGCVEEFTPADRLGSGRYDPRLRRVRRRLDAPRCDLRTVERLVAYARDRAAAITGAGRVRDFDLDVAVDVRTGKPTIVELNGMTNAGLYASDPHAILKALLETA